MNNNKWSKKQEDTFSGNRFGVSEKEYKVRPDHYLRSLREDTNIKKGDTILCLGCNDGTHVNTFYFEGYNAFGCDLPKVIERARYRYLRIAERLLSRNLDDDKILSVHTWNIIFAKSVIEHLVNWKSLPKKMYDAQPIGGMVWVATKNGTIDEQPEHDHFVHIGFEELENIFKNAGYAIVKHYKDPLCDKGQILVAKKE